MAEHIGEEVTLQGWLYAKTDKGRLQFLQVRDGSGLCQAVVFKKNVSEEDFAAMNWTRPAWKWCRLPKSTPSSPKSTG
jgi:aspartyl/asparaginyl-tRNA synthetase